MRPPVLIMPRMMFGVPNSRTLMMTEKPWVPWPVRIWARAFLTRVFRGRMEQWGFRTPKTRTHPISHPTLISHIAWKRIAVRPGIQSIAGAEVQSTGMDVSTRGRNTAVIFADGAGAVVLALGGGMSVIGYRVMQRIARLPEEQRVLR